MSEFTAGEKDFLLDGRPVRTEVRAYPLEEANAALEDLRSGRLRGAAVLDLGGSR